MKLDADFYYNLFANDPDVIEGNIQDAAGSKINLENLTSERAKKLFEFSEDVTNLMTARTLLDGFANNSEMSDFMNLLSFVKKEAVVDFMKDSEEISAMFSTMGAMETLIERTINTFEKDEANGEKFNPKTMEYSGDNASFSIMVGAMNQAVKNLREFRELYDNGINLAKDKDILAVASWVKEVKKHGDKEVSDDLVKGFIDICTDRDKYLQEHPYEFNGKGFDGVNFKYRMSDNKENEKVKSNVNLKVKANNKEMER